MPAWLHYTIEAASSIAGVFLYVYLGLSALTKESEYSCDSIDMVVILLQILMQNPISVSHVIMYILKVGKLGLKIK